MTFAALKNDVPSRPWQALKKLKDHIENHLPNEPSRTAFLSGLNFFLKISTEQGWFPQKTSNPEHDAQQSKLRLESAKAYPAEAYKQWYQLGVNLARHATLLSLNSEKLRAIMAAISKRSQKKWEERLQEALDNLPTPHIEELFEKFLVKNKLPDKLENIYLESNILEKSLTFFAQNIGGTVLYKGKKTTFDWELMTQLIHTHIDSKAFSIVNLLKDSFITVTEVNGKKLYSIGFSGSDKEKLTEQLLSLLHWAFPEKNYLNLSVDKGDSYMIALAAEDIQNIIHYFDRLEAQYNKPLLFRSAKFNQTEALVQLLVDNGAISEHKDKLAMSVALEKADSEKAIALISKLTVDQVIKYRQQISESAAQYPQSNVTRIMIAHLKKMVDAKEEELNQIDAQHLMHYAADTRLIPDTVDYYLSYLADTREKVKTITSQSASGNVTTTITLATAQQQVHARRLWGEMLSQAHSYNQSYISQHKIIDNLQHRLSSLGIPESQFSQVLTSCIHFLQNKTSLIVSFNEQKLSGMQQHQLLNVFQKGLLGRAPSYLTDRKNVETELFSAFASREFMDNPHALPCYGALYLLDPRANRYPDAITHYGNSYLVLKDVVKLNSLFLASDSMLAAPRKIVTTYNNLELLLYNCTMKKFTAIVKWATEGVLPLTFNQLFSENEDDVPEDYSTVSYMEALLPHINFFDANLVSEIFLNSESINAETISMLEERGINVHIIEKDPYKKLNIELEAAIMSDDIDAVARLYPLMMKMENEYYPKYLEKALSVGSKQVFEFLFKKGLSNEEYDQFKALSSPNPSLYKNKFDLSEIVNTRFRVKGWTMLHFASFTQNARLIDQLLALGANIHLQNNNFSRADESRLDRIFAQYKQELRAAIINNDETVIQHYAQQKKSLLTLPIDAQKTTPLTLALRKDKQELFLYLLNCCPAQPQPALDLRWDLSLSSALKEALKLGQKDKAKLIAERYLPLYQLKSNQRNPNDYKSRLPIFNKGLGYSAALKKQAVDLLVRYVNGEADANELLAYKSVLGNGELGLICQGLQIDFKQMQFKPGVH